MVELRDPRMMDADNLCSILRHDFGNRSIEAVVFNKMLDELRVRNKHYVRAVRVYDKPVYCTGCTSPARKGSGYGIPCPKLKAAVVCEVWQYIDGCRNSTTQFFLDCFERPDHTFTIAGPYYV